LSIATRRAIDKYIHRGYIQIDGSYIPMQRGDFEDIVAEKYCKDEVTLEKFSSIMSNSSQKMELQMIVCSYQKVQKQVAVIVWLNQIKYFGSRIDVFATMTSTEATLLNCSKRSISDSMKILNCPQKFLIDYPDLMKRYDLRDEYEIHNLLKKIHAEKENPQMVFGGCPASSLACLIKIVP
jgi:predicted aconitase